MNAFRAHQEFHVSRRARDRYHFDASLFSLEGRVILANFYAARLFADRMNAQRDLVRHPEEAVRASDVSALGLLDEILHSVMAAYRAERNPHAMEEALAWLEEELGEEPVGATLRRFAEDFPPLAVYRGERSLAEYLSDSTEDVPNREIVLEELLMLWLTNRNPAARRYAELFDDEELQEETDYPRLMASLYEFFDTQPHFGPDNENLIDMLSAPARAAPDSLQAQLEYVASHWAFLAERYRLRLLTGLDFIREDHKGAPPGPGRARVYEYGQAMPEPERFSMDLDWMPSVVLIAKHTFVWLDQLSRRYERPIRRLDEIPDEELDRLGSWGITGLWLIGLWERSPASKRIKQLRGNPEAEASAYSLFDYRIADELGGDAALEELRRRARQKGIRLASDMVPNHMGIDSRWVIEHPDWFIQVEHSPFPGYTFDGPDLSWDERVGIFLEDHYYDGSDAAVVFKRLDHRTGDTRYVYHGNDGTAMPWNDTAQLNYLLPEVREAVLETILHVAEEFSVIRFDAAMTLAKKHYQRLWFPEPGEGGAIPTRAEHGMTKAAFDEVFPTEFWRMVVDRVAEEAPDTLLLAEAFWLMEGYFVRTLGMHRVYNSAFMNMLRDERNQEYRLVIKNTIEFDPEILKRYVNFLNNPDERTAVDQFGKGDKYFGVCTLMATMPGLPMLGHGQIEGYAEKYGMEFRRAYWDEEADAELVARHEREIFFLLRKRYLFAQVDNFLLYDFYTGEGYVNEDVFAYSNRVGQESALVVYHNRYADTAGWIRRSVAYRAKDEGDGELITKSLAEGLALPDDQGQYVIFRDHVSGLEYIRNCRELCQRGLYVALGGYHYHVFVDFRLVQDVQGYYGQLAEELQGRGVPSIDARLRQIVLRPVLAAFEKLLDARRLEELWALPAEEDEDRLARLLDGLTQDYAVLLRRITKQLGRIPDEGTVAGLATQVREQVRRTLAGDEFSRLFPFGRGHLMADKESAAKGLSLAWLLVRRLGKVARETDWALVSRGWLDEWFLDDVVAEILRDLGLEQETAARAVTLLKVLIVHHAWRRSAGEDVQDVLSIAQGWLADEDVRRFIGLHRYTEALWFNKEAFEDLLRWMLAIALLGAELDQDLTEAERRSQVQACVALVGRLEEALPASEYRVEGLLAALTGD